MGQLKLKFGIIKRFLENATDQCADYATDSAPKDAAAATLPCVADHTCYYYYYHYCAADNFHSAAAAAERAISLDGYVSGEQQTGDSTAATRLESCRQRG